MVHCFRTISWLPGEFDLLAGYFEDDVLNFHPKNVNLKIDFDVDLTLICLRQVFILSSLL